MSSIFLLLFLVPLQLELFFCQNPFCLHAENYRAVLNLT